MPNASSLSLSPNNCVGQFCRLFRASKRSPVDFAIFALAHYEVLCDLVMEEIGYVPSSEAELAWLQKVYS